MQSPPKRPRSQHGSGVASLYAMLLFMEKVTFIPKNLIDETLATSAVSGKRLLEPLKTFSLERGVPMHILEDTDVDNPPEVHEDEANALAAMSSAQKNITVEEQIIHEWAFHSVVTNRDLAKDEPLSLENVRPARPGWGIPAKYLDERYSSKLLGKKVNKDISVNQVIYWRDIA